MFILGAIRPGSLVIVGLSIFGWVAIATLYSGGQPLLCLALIAGAWVVALILVELFGRVVGNSESFESYVDMAVNGVSQVDLTVRETLQTDVGAQSVTRSIAQPDGLMSIIPTATVRLWGYVVAPWPSQSFADEWTDANGFRRVFIATVAAQSVLLVIALGFASAHLVSYFRRRVTQQLPLVPAVAMITSLFTTTLGIPIVHERYRAIATIWALPVIVAAMSSRVPKRARILGILAWVFAAMAAVMVYYRLQ
jgi:hypothetical protein